ncbi:MAG: hypothetical protein ABIG20_00565 [archaeon]
MPKIDAAILDYIKRAGPSTPIEISQRVGVDSIVVSAILVDASGQNRIAASKRRVGSQRLYYYPDQKRALEKKINSILTQQDKEVLQVLMDHKALAEADVDEGGARLLENLEDLVSAFTLQNETGTMRCWYTPNIREEQAKDIIMKRLFPKRAEREEPKVEEKEEPKAEPKRVERDAQTRDNGLLKPPIRSSEPKPEPKKVEPKQTELVPKGKKEPEDEEEERKISDDEREQIRKELLAEMRGSFRDNVLQWFEKQEIDLMEEKVIKEGQEVELEVKVPTPLGKQNYLVKVFDYAKKGVSQNDLATVGMDAISRRIPAIVISSTGFAKSAKKYWKKELEDLVTLMSDDDLE